MEKRLSIESLSSRHQKNTLRVYISIREIIVSTRSRTLTGSHAVEKISWTSEREKDLET